MANRYSAQTWYVLDLLFYSLNLFFGEDRTRLKLRNLKKFGPNCGPNVFTVQKRAGSAQKWYILDLLFYSTNLFFSENCARPKLGKFLNKGQNGRGQKRACPTHIRPKSGSSGFSFLFSKFIFWRRPHPTKIAEFKKFRSKFRSKFFRGPKKGPIGPNVIHSRFTFLFSKSIF